jgi:hypothetical protein
MQRARSVLALTSILSVGFIFYAHDQQVRERARMHEGVLRDLAREKEEEAAAATSAAATAAAPDCASGVCDLAVRRVRPVAAA